MIIDPHMEPFRTSKNSDFVKDILKKRQIAQIVIEIAVMPSKTTSKTAHQPAEEASKTPESGSGSRRKST